MRNLIILAIVQLCGNGLFTEAQISGVPFTNTIGSTAREIVARANRVVASNFRKPTETESRSRSRSFNEIVAEKESRLPQFVHPKTKDTPRIPYQFENNTMPQFLRIVQKFMMVYGNTSTDPASVSKARRYGKLQDIIPDSVPFPCDLSIGARSAVRPDRVDRVTPGDIDIIAGLGDSLTAGSGVAGTNMAEDLIQNRGLTALGGGQGTWRQFFTIPNVLKLFNPNLTGYGTGDAMFGGQAYHQKLNLAEAGAMIQDMPDSARILVEKLSKYPGINVEEDWKFVSIFVGSVDFCIDLCYWKKPWDAPAVLENAMRETLDILYNNLNRTIVAVVYNIDIPKYMSHLNLKSNCALQKAFGCPCVNGDSYRSIKKEYGEVVELVIKGQERAASDPKYRRKDFAVMIIPAFKNTDLVPKVMIRGKEYSDARYLAGDCYHLSQRGQAHGARVMWNSMLTPTGGKPLWTKEEPELLCPTKENPYIQL